MNTLSVASHMWSLKCERSNAKKDCVAQYPSFFAALNALQLLLQTQERRPDGVTRQYTIIDPRGAECAKVRLCVPKPNPPESVLPGASRQELEGFDIDDIVAGLEALYGSGAATKGKSAAKAVRASTVRPMPGIFSQTSGHMYVDSRGRPAKFCRMTIGERKAFIRAHDGFLSRVRERLTAEHGIEVSPSTITRYWYGEFKKGRHPAVIAALDQEYVGHLNQKRQAASRRGPAMCAETAQPETADVNARAEPGGDAPAPSTASVPPPRITKGTRIFRRKFLETHRDFLRSVQTSLAAQRIAISEPALQRAWLADYSEASPAVVNALESAFRTYGRVDEHTKPSHNPASGLRMPRQKREQTAPQQAERLPAQSGSVMDMKETAEYLGVTIYAMRHMVERAQIPTVRIAGRVLFDRDALDAWVDPHRRIRRK